MNMTAADRAALLALVGRFERQQILVTGDLVADEFVHGEIARVSREAPVLILRERSRRIVPGGGANAANNLAELGAKVRLAGAVGEDAAGEALLGYFRERGVATGGVARVKGYATPAKCRVLGSLGHGQPQQIVRIDREPRKLNAAARARILRGALARIQGADAALVSDYGFGAVDPAGARRLRRARALPVVVDSRYDILRYNHVTASTPNEPEMREARGKPGAAADSLRELHRMAGWMLRRCALKALLVTRGREGMALYQPGQRPLTLSVFGRGQVADVTGAGDTVIAAFTLSLAAGASYAHAAMAANCAGGLVVMKSGTAVVSARELREALRNV